MIGAVKRRPWIAASAGVALAALFAFALLHAPPVRARVLDLVLARLAQAGIAARADGLDYNLATLEVRIHRLTLATPAASGTPFLTADTVRAVLGWGILRGRIDIVRFEAAHPRVVLVRNERGEVNWPTSDEPGQTSLDALNLGVVDLPDLDFSFQDQRAPGRVDLEGLAVHLTPQPMTGTSGTLRLARPGRVVWNDRHTTIDRLEGGVAWSGRDLSLDGLQLALPEARLSVGGRIDRV